MITLDLTPDQGKLLHNTKPGDKISLKLHTGEVFVAQQTETRQQIIERKFSPLIGQPITVTDAANKYNVHRDTVLVWVKNRYVTALKHGGRGSRMELDEADIAYCAEIHHKRGGISGAPLLDDDGLPYELKHPDLSKYRQKRRKTT